MEQTELKQVSVDVTESALFTAEELEFQRIGSTVSKALHPFKVESMTKSQGSKFSQRRWNELSFKIVQLGNNIDDHEVYGKAISFKYDYNNQTYRFTKISAKYKSLDVFYKFQTLLLKIVGSSKLSSIAKEDVWCVNYYISILKSSVETGDFRTLCQIIFDEMANVKLWKNDYDLK